MKCKVCGYEYDEGRYYCPMCGARTKASGEKITAEEMQWNTKSFPTPKPKNEEPMQWSSPDASEGFINIPEKVKEPQAVVKAEVLEAMNGIKPVHAVNPMPENPNKKKYEPEHFVDMSHTFSSAEDDFQKALDKEFERLNLKVQEDDDEEDLSKPAPYVLKLREKEKKAPERVSRPQRSRNVASIDLPVQPKKADRGDRFDIDAIEDTIESIVAAEAKAQAESSERKKKLAAMAAARDAYFKSLDDGEFESKNPNRYDPNAQNTNIKKEPVVYERQEAVQAEEKYIEPQSPIKAPSDDKELYRPVASWEAPNLEELAGKLEPSPEHTQKFDKTAFAELNEKAYGEEKAEEKEPEIEEVFEAAEEVNSETEEETSEEEKSEEEKFRGSMYSPSFSLSEEDYIADYPEMEEEEEPEIEWPEENEVTEKEGLLTDEQLAEIARQYAAEEKAKNLDDIYAVEEDEDDEPKHKFSFIKFILVFALIIGVIELVIAILYKLIPESEIVKQAALLNDVVLKAIGEYLKIAWEYISKYSKIVWNQIVSWYNAIKETISGWFK